MQSFLFLLVTASLLSTYAQASTICLVQPDASKTAFESDSLTILTVDSDSNRLISTQAKVSETDSAPFGNVIKTYSQENGSQVTGIHYINSKPSALVVNEGNKELPLSFNSKQTTAQGAACYDIGR